MCDKLIRKNFEQISGLSILEVIVSKQKNEQPLGCGPPDVAQAGKLLHPTAQRCRGRQRRYGGLRKSRYSIGIRRDVEYVWYLFFVSCLFTSNDPGRVSQDVSGSGCDPAAGWFSSLSRPRRSPPYSLCAFCMHF
jgi:hypothetical protein